MTARPIIFSAPMIRALIAGRKTQTRRVLGKKGSHANIFNAEVGWTDDYVLDPENAEWRARYTPYAIGDRLYVREACRAEELPDGTDGVRYFADGAWRAIENTEAASAQWVDLFHYRTRGKNGIGCNVPPIHMPRWASRLTLTVTDVRVQRLQDISEADAMAEGVARLPPLMTEVPGATCTIADVTHRNGFRDLWNSLHGPDAWYHNPWVVALTFTVQHRNIDAETANA